jgi:hypothetical protein
MDTQLNAHLETLAERNKFATTAVGIKGRSRPTLQLARARLLARHSVILARQEKKTPPDNTH